MKSRKPILYLAIVFALVCVYQLSFTWKVGKVEENATKYAISNIDENLNNELLALDTTITDSIIRSVKSEELKTNYINNRDIILENLEREYIKKESR